MGLRERVRRGTRTAWRHVGHGSAALASAAGRAAEAIGYRKAELVVIGLLAASLLGGFAVDVWRRRDPTMLSRLEAEPPRLGAALRPSPPHPAPSRPSARSPGMRARIPAEAPRDGDAEASPTAVLPLDLNRATADDLVRLPGIGRVLATRILARRDLLGGFESTDELARVPGIGPDKATRLRPLVAVPTAPAPRVDARDPLEPWEPP